MRYQIFSVFGPWGLTPWPKFTKRGDGLADSEVYHPAKFHRSMPTYTQDIPYKHAHTHTQKQTNKQYTIYPQHAYRHVWSVRYVYYDDSLFLFYGLLWAPMFDHSVWSVIIVDSRYSVEA